MAKYVTIPGSEELSRLNELLQDKETVDLLESLMEDMFTEQPLSSTSSTPPKTADKTASDQAST